MSDPLAQALSDLYGAGNVTTASQGNLSAFGDLFNGIPTTFAEAAGVAPGGGPGTPGGVGGGALPTGTSPSIASQIGKFLGGDTGAAIAGNVAGYLGGTSDPTEGYGGAPQSDPVGDWFQRGTVVILGFIFVAVGLSMFRASNG